MHRIFFFLSSTFGIYRKIYRKFESTNADNETVCTVLLTSQVVMIQSIQPKGRKFESTCVKSLFFYYNPKVVSSSPHMFLFFLFCIFIFIQFV